jgi:hypothetical protein
VNRPATPVVTLVCAASYVAIALAGSMAVAGRVFFGALAALFVGDAVWTAVIVRRARRYLATADRTADEAAPEPSGP